MSTQVTFYVARAHDGTFSCGRDWVDDIDDARLYRTISPAKSAVTKRARQNPEEPIADILEWRLDISSATVIDQTSRTRKVLGRIEKERAEQRAENMARRREELAWDIARKQEELERISR